MKDIVVTENNYKRIVLSRMITLCWVILIGCWLVKIFGGNFFRYVGESKFAEYLENNAILLCIFQFLLYFLSSFLFLKTMIKNNKVVILTTIIMFAVKQLSVINNIFYSLSIIIEAIALIIIPIITGTKWYKAILMYLILMLFEIISLITKDLSIIKFADTTISAYMYMIDYYVMLGLMLLYSKQGGFKFMRIGLIFLSTDKTQLEEYKKILTANHNNKISKLNNKFNSEIEKIDKKINKCSK